MEKGIISCAADSEKQQSGNLHRSVALDKIAQERLEISSLTVLPPSVAKWQNSSDCLTLLLGCHPDTRMILIIARAQHASHFLFSSLLRPFPPPSKVYSKMCRKGNEREERRTQTAPTSLSLKKLYLVLLWVTSHCTECTGHCQSIALFTYSEELHSKIFQSAHHNSSHLVSVQRDRPQPHDQFLQH